MINADYKKNRHSCFNLKYHLVVVTKYRHQVLTKDVGLRLIEITKTIFEDNWNSNILEINYERDHIHILFEAPPQVQLSKLINNFKTVSSRLIRKEFKTHVERYYWKPYFWSNSYLILTTGGATIDIIHKGRPTGVKKYIKNQSTPVE